MLRCIVEQESLIHFMQLLNEQFMTTKGYGSGAFLSISAVMLLYRRMIIQNLSEKEEKLFIKRFVNNS